MRTWRPLTLWLFAGLVGIALLAGFFPRVFPFLPWRWEVTQEEAVSIALEKLRDLGPPVSHPYVVAWLEADTLLERRLQKAVGHDGLESLRATGLPERLVSWVVLVFPPDAPTSDWVYQARISLSGKVQRLSLHLDPKARSGSGTLPAAEARSSADVFLRSQGIDPARFGEPEVRSQQLAARTDLTVRYSDLHPAPLAGGHFGVDVSFAGDRLAGFAPWLEDTQERALQRDVQEVEFLGFANVILSFLLVALLAIPFLKRYHEGEIGVRRGVQIFLVVTAVGLIGLVLAARTGSQGVGFGFASRQQTTWLYVLFSFVFRTLSLALLSFFAWSVGEALCRERGGHKLAAFDALFQGEWANRTVARSSFVGIAAGLLLGGVSVALQLAVRPFGGWPLQQSVYGGGTVSPGLEALTAAASSLPNYLVVALCIVPFAVKRFGRWKGALLGIPFAAIVVLPPCLPLPLGWGIPLALVTAAFLITLFLAYDLLAVLLAGFVAQILLVAYPLVRAADPTLQANGWLALGVAFLPLLLSVRCLGRGPEFVYRYEDVPPHVRRIAERERQRVELETARGIQSSILPDLPASLLGVEIAHRYLPASEVGGDFYDVLALEDGRLAVAVGDVAGHGVSSGLVMSMAKSALAVQVTFDPEVAAVFRTLNRMVFQTARKRLLSTLCYAILDPQRRELLFASAGHLFPYRVSAGGAVSVLESIGYPLGVRGLLKVKPQRVALDPGDYLFLCSDGLVEARKEGSEDLYGFDRLEQSLSRHAREGTSALLEGVLADVTRFTRHAPREDDLTALVLRLPAA